MELTVKRIPINQVCFGYLWGLYEGDELVGRFDSEEAANKLKAAFNMTYSDRRDEEARHG